MIDDENLGGGKWSPFPDQTLEYVDFDAEVEYEVDRFSELTTDKDRATCVTSIMRGLVREGEESWPFGQYHRPVLDIDIPIKVVPSSTPGHSHLFIDHAMAWPAYQKLLHALAEAGIVESGYVAASVRRGHTSARLPHVKKKLQDITDDADLTMLLNETHDVLRSLQERLTSQATGTESGQLS